LLKSKSAQKFIGSIFIACCLAFVFTVWQNPNRDQFSSNLAIAIVSIFLAPLTLFFLITLFGITISIKNSIKNAHMFWIICIMLILATFYFWFLCAIIKHLA
jgi:hypothetical protein